MLEVGQKAPDFILPDQNGNDISLSDFSGNKVVLWFFPKASTPGWTIEGQGFRDELKNFKKKNVVVLGMSEIRLRGKKTFAIKKVLIFQYWAMKIKLY